MMTIHVFAVHQVIQRYRGGTSLKEDEEGRQSAVEDQDKQSYALDNGGFRSDENGNTENKNKGTQL